MSAPRARYQDVVPYDIPSSLDVLSGPPDGLLELPHSIHWGPSRSIDLGDPVELAWGYQAIVREGSALQHRELLHGASLIRVWSALILPARCRALWENSFPVLNGTTPAGAAR